MRVPPELALLATKIHLSSCDPRSLRIRDPTPFSASFIVHAKIYSHTMLAAQRPAAPSTTADTPVDTATPCETIWSKGAANLVSPPPAPPAAAVAAAIVTKAT